MMAAQHTMIKLMADIGASTASLFVLVSHFAMIVTPILTLFIAAATSLWWVIRFREIWRTGKAGED